MSGISSDPDPTTDPALKSRLTIRMEMFEVYEKTSDGPRLLFATSDPSLAKDASRPGDQIVKRWWTRGEAVK